ncbi:MAG: hypothetical protein WBZ04_12075 [Candidatus Nanopelagicales bacterium]
MSELRTEAQPAVNVYLGTPVAGGVVAHDYMHSVFAIQRHFEKLGWGLKFVTQPDGLVTRPRNAFASVVVRNEEFTHLLMLDADVVIAPESVERMIRADHDVVGAGVPLRQVDWNKVRDHLDLIPSATAAELRSVSHRFAAWFEPRGGSRVPVDGFLPALVIGSAALLISRETLCRLVEESAVDAFKFGAHASDGKESGWTFFDPFVSADGVYLSEDYAFCERVRGIDGQVWVDLESPTKHVGPVAIEGEISTTLSAASQAARARRERDAD